MLQPFGKEIMVCAQRAVLMTLLLTIADWSPRRTFLWTDRRWTDQFTMDATHAEPKGYLAARQTPDGIIHLISSGIHYRFNLAWLRLSNQDP